MKNTCKNPLIITWRGDDTHPDYGTNKIGDATGEYVDKEIADILVETLRSVREGMNMHLYEEGTVGNRYYKEIQQAIRKATQ